MVDNQELSRVSRRLRMLFDEVCGGNAQYHVFTKQDPVTLQLEGILVFRATRQNTTPVVVLLMEEKDAIFVVAKYFTGPGTFSEKKVGSTSDEIADLQPLFSRALTFP